MRMDWESLIHAILAGTVVVIWAVFVTFGLIWLLYKMGILQTCGG